MKLWRQVADDGGRWGRRGRLVALVDQSTYTGANFLISISIAMSAGVDALGRFALISSVATLVLGLLNSVSLEPMTVFGSHAGGRRLRAACVKGASVLAVAMLATAAATLLLARSAGWARSADLSLGMILCASQYCVLARKRSLYILGHFGRSTQVSVIYAAAVGLSLMLALALKEMSAGSAVAATFAGALCSTGAWILRSTRLRVRIMHALLHTKGFFRYVLGASGTSVAGAVAYQGTYWVGALTGGVQLVGKVKLIEQLMLPYVQLVMMLTMPDQVLSSRDFAHARDTEISRRIFRRTVLFTVGAVAYSLLVFAAVAVWGSAHAAGRVLAPAVLAYGLVLLLQSAAYPRLTATRARRRPYVIGFAYAAMGACVVAGGLLFHPTSPVGLVMLLAAAWLLNLIVLGIGGRPSGPRGVKP